MKKFIRTPDYSRVPYRKSLTFAHRSVCFPYSYLFWFMQKFLHSPKWLLGMTNTVAGISAVPVVAASTLIIKWCGHTKIFMMSLIVYGVRFLAYSYVYNPYLILPVEILEAFTFSLTWVIFIAIVTENNHQLWVSLGYRNGVLWKNCTKLHSITTGNYWKYALFYGLVCH